MSQTTDLPPEASGAERAEIDSGIRNPVVLFDGVCNLCDHAVQFMIAHDPSGRLRYTSLQSPSGQRILGRFNLPTEGFSSVVLIENDRCYQHSTAALRIARHFGGLWCSLLVFMVIPRFVRDAAYHFIADNRYRWFGKKDLCMMPTPELRARFLL